MPYRLGDHLIPGLVYVCTPPEGTPGNHTHRTLLVPGHHQFIEKSSAEFLRVILILGNVNIWWRHSTMVACT